MLVKEAVDLVDMRVAMDLSRDFTDQTPRSVSLPSSKALQKCDCGISKLELRAVVMIKIESPHSGISGAKALLGVCSFIGSSDDLQPPTLVTLPVGGTSLQVQLITHD